MNSRLAPVGLLAALLANACAAPAGDDEPTSTDELRAAIGGAEFQLDQATIEVTASSAGSGLAFSARVERPGYQPESFTCLLGGGASGTARLACGAFVTTFAIELSPAGAATIALGDGVAKSVASNPELEPIPALGLRGMAPRPLTVGRAHGVHPFGIATAVTDAIAHAGAVSTASGSLSIESWSLVAPDLSLSVRLDPPAGGAPSRLSCESSGATPVLWTTRADGYRSQVAPVSVLAERIETSALWMLDNCQPRSL